MSADSLTVDSSNVEQLRAWDGDEGRFWADHPDYFDRALAGYHAEFLAAAAIGTDDRVLDIGCGTGQSTRDAARLAAAGSALGVDLSSAMLAVARARSAAEGLTNVRFVQADAQVHPFQAESFDVAIARTSAMFFGDRVAGLRNVAAALRGGGRLVLLTWQPPSANEWIGAFTAALAGGRELPVPPADAPGPFTLADPEVIRSILTRAGYAGIAVEPMREPMWFGADVEDAFHFVTGLLGWMLDGLDGAGRKRALGVLRETLAAHETHDGVLFASATWLVRAVRAS